MRWACIPIARQNPHLEPNIYCFSLDKNELRHKIFDFFGNNLDLVLNALMNHTGVLIRAILCIVLQQLIIVLGQGRDSSYVF